MIHFDAWWTKSVEKRAQQILFKKRSVGLRASPCADLRVFKRGSSLLSSVVAIHSFSQVTSETYVKNFAILG